jgi:DNA mismatch repair ATPase MutS
MSIFVAEKEAFESLRSEVRNFYLFSRMTTNPPQVNAYSLQLRRNARLLDELDVTLSFANLATERNFVKPLLKDE